MTDPTSASTAEARHLLLSYWRSRKLNSGVSPDDLITENDVNVLAEKGLDAHVPLENRSAFLRDRDELRGLLHSSSAAPAPAPGNGARPPEPDRGTQPPGAQQPDARQTRPIGTEPITGPITEPITVGVGGSAPPASPPPSSAAGWFAAYEPDGEFDQQPPARLKGVSVTAEGHLRYRWTAPPPTSDSRLYRVVVSDEHAPFSPDDPDSLLEVTSGTAALDQRPVTSAVRHVQVWLNQGPDEAAARAEQPTIVVQDEVVAPPTAVTISQDGRQVVGAWRVQPGIRKVEVYRIPAVRAAYTPSDLQYQVSRYSPNLDGFREDDCPAGKYQYRLYAITDSDDGDELRSPPALHERVVLAPLARVLDLRVTTSPDEPGTVDLEWTGPPVGEVQIYRTETGPAPGSGDTEMSDDPTAFAGARLPADARLNRPVEREGTAQRMRRVPIPPAADPDSGGRVYFTPVTVSAGKAWVGVPAVHYRLGEVVEPLLVQRVDWQYVSFGWPAGATTVHAHITPRGGSVPDRLADPVKRLDREEYQLQGGLVLEGVLPAMPCDVHLTPVVVGRTSTAGRTASVPYPGLIRIWYQAPRRVSIRAIRSVSVRSDSDIRSQLKFVAVFNGDRLPLSIGDGRQVASWSSALRKGQEWQALGEITKVGPGYIRIFVDLPDAPVDIAVIDPTLDQLIW